MAILWFRYYTDALNDPKVQLLPGEVFKAWMNLLCVVKEHDHGGELPGPEELAFRLRMTVDSLEPLFKRLIADGLIDHEGGRYAVHNWERRQYRSDSDPTALDRKRRQRALKNVTPELPAPEAPKVVKHRHGKFGHVLLTDDQLADLKAKFNGKTEGLITRLDEYIEMKGATYKNHALTIQNWARKDGIEPHGARPEVDKKRMSDPVFGGVK